MKTILQIFILMLLQTIGVYAQPGDSIIRPDTLHVGDTLCFADTITQYVAEFMYPNGKDATVHGVTNCIGAASRAPSGTRIYVKEIIAVNRFGKKVRLRKRYYYVK